MVTIQWDLMKFTVNLPSDYINKHVSLISAFLQSWTICQVKAVKLQRCTVIFVCVFLERIVVNFRQTP